jgi:hypothetical protein
LISTEQPRFPNLFHRFSTDNPTTTPTAGTQFG